MALSDKTPGSQALGPIPIHTRPYDLRLKTT
jgi:hypothetical protein